jgi:hypothetical protein
LPPELLLRIMMRPSDTEQAQPMSDDSGERRTMPRLLVVHHFPTPGVQTLTDHVAASGTGDLGAWPG